MIPPQQEALRVSGLSAHDFEARLARLGLGVQIGPFLAHIRCNIPEIVEPLRRLYGDYPLVGNDQVFSFRLRLERRRFVAPRVRFSVDGRVPHEDLPLDQALAVLEWGMNLVVALRLHRFLMLHAAVLERNGGALVLPAAPGAGKTTLCAALAHRGWRLFSDEFGLVRHGSRELLPVPRPMSLKNESIDVIRSFLPEAEFGPTIENTRKGTVAHVKAPASSIFSSDQPAPVRWVVFPRWQAGQPLSIERIPKSEAFLSLATNAFNYEAVGEEAFLILRDAVNTADCYRLVYSRLDEVVPALTALADEAR